MKNPFGANLLNLQAQSYTLARYFVRLSFKGTHYAGWQIQDNAISVQETLNKAISTVTRQPISTTGCGRTDTGVHASMFYAHFDCEPLSEAPEKLIMGINAVLPHDISVKELFPVSDDQHARYSALKRTYEYFITDKPDPFYHEYSMLSYKLPDIVGMNLACEKLLGEHDFASFCKSDSGLKHYHCTVYEACWKERSGVLVFTVTANRFLRGMVRALTGTLLQIGHGKLEPAAIENIIAARNRSAAGSSAPAAGLFLTRIEYPFIATPLPVRFPV